MTSTFENTLHEGPLDSLLTSTVESVKIANIVRYYGLSRAQARSLVEAYGYDRDALKAAVHRLGETTDGLNRTA